MELPVVSWSQNRIVFSKMDSPLLVGRFLNALYTIIEKQGYTEVVIDCSGVGRAFPNVLVPVAGITDYYKSKGINFTFENLSDYLTKSNIFSPLEVGKNQRVLDGNALNLIWRYHSDSDAYLLSKEILRSFSQEVICEEGVIDALLWCMNEVMDNVIVHSKSDSGFVMGQIHKQTKHIAFCVYDHGQGIYNSLKDSPHSPHSPLEAIELAIQERVTRDRKIGQGNGMWGLSEIVKINSGRLTIISGSGFYMRSNGDVNTGDNLTYLSPSNGGCLVDFQLNYNKTISLTQALKGHKPTNYRTESFEDDSGTINFRLVEAKSGVGSRESGKRIRNDLINMFLETKKGISIDFEGLSVVSSSFADELVGKMLVHFGFFGFNQIVRLKNMNPTIQAIVERSVAQRMAEAFT